MTPTLPCSEAGMKSKAHHKDKRQYDCGMLGRKGKPINQPGVFQLYPGWVSSSTQEAERTTIILENSPTDGQRATNQKTVFIPQPGVGENAKASCTDIALGGERQWPPGRPELDNMFVLALPLTSCRILGMSSKLSESQFFSFVTKDQF